MFLIQTDVLKVIATLRPAGAIQWEAVTTEYNRVRKNMYQERDMDSLRRKYKYVLIFMILSLTI
jgi:hypothetical protein